MTGVFYNSIVTVVSDVVYGAKETKESRVVGSGSVARYDVTVRGFGHI